MYCGPTDDDAFDAYLGPYADFVERTAKVSADPTKSRAADAPRNPIQADDPTAMKESLVCGSPDSCAKALQDLRNLGIENVIFS